MGETGNMLKIFQEESVKEALERLSQNYEVEGLVVANKEGILLYSYHCKNYSEECVAVLGGILFSFFENSKKIVNIILRMLYFGSGIFYSISKIKIFITLQSLLRYV